MPQKMVRTRSLLFSASAVLLAAGCAAKYGTTVPAMPISMDQAQAQANVRQAGINVSRQFVGTWENAKGTMKNSLAQCAMASRQDQSACWQKLQSQANAFSTEFAGMTVQGLSPEQMRSFGMARQAAVQFFQLSSQYAQACGISIARCVHDDRLRYRMNAERKAVDGYLLNARIIPGNTGQAMQYAGRSVDQNLEAMRNPAMTPPADNQPLLQNDSGANP
ncbi:MAG: hypothetical protein ACP5D5_07565 [Acidithiobacillus sp.]|uniref:hypothetical protein n=1 Tax=Acidithiobacillus sp. TaxID=1872118 RepID=UPI003CFF1416